MSQSSLINKLSRVLRALKYPLLIAIIAGIVWYMRSQPIPVSSHTVSTGSVVRSVMGTGTLEARIRTTISPKIQGRIAEVLVDQGSMVKAGQLLVRLASPSVECGATPHFRTQAGHRRPPGYSVGSPSVQADEKFAPPSSVAAIPLFPPQSSAYAN